MSIFLELVIDDTVEEEVADRDGAQAMMGWAASIFWTSCDEDESGDAFSLLPLPSILMCFTRRRMSVSTCCLTAGDVHAARYRWRRQPARTQMGWGGSEWENIRDMTQHRRQYQLRELACARPALCSVSASP